MIELLRPPVDPDNPDGPYGLQTLLTLEESGLLAKGDPEGILTTRPISTDNIGLKVVRHALAPGVPEPNIDIDPIAA